MNKNFLLGISIGLLIISLYIFYLIGARNVCIEQNQTLNYSVFDVECVKIISPKISNKNFDLNFDVNKLLKDMGGINESKRKS